MTISPPMKIKSAIPRIAVGTIQNNFRFPLVIINYLMLSKLSLHKFFIHALQAPSELQHRIAFAREQRIHAHASLFRQVLKAAPFQFVRDEYFPLLVRQFLERKLQFVKKQIAEIESFWPGIRR